MPTEFLIRAVSVEDREAWEGLWQGYNASYGRSGDTALPSETVQTTWSRLLDDREPLEGVVAESAAGLVGLAHFIFHRNTIHVEDTCYLQDLFTSEESRGLGIARQLVEAVYETCRSRGVSSVYWHTHSTNGTARALYDTIANNTEFLVYRARI